MLARRERTFVPLSMEGSQRRYFIPCCNNCCLVVVRNFLAASRLVNLRINSHVNNELQHGSLVIEIILFLSQRRAAIKLH